MKWQSNMNVTSAAKSTTIIDLLPCPFCGSQAKLWSEKENAAGTRFVFWVRCDFRGDLNCDVIPTTPKFDTAEQAVKAWNTRASGWIPCSERMPDEPGVHVLVTDGVHIMESWYEMIDGEMLWVDNYTMYVNINFGEVTHWMPLPEVP